MHDRTAVTPDVPAGSALDVKLVNLALQGGGAHGAFAWGVLDRLLADPRIAFEGISATSAGAMNAVVTAYGLTIGGREGARKALAGFWRRVSQAEMFSMLQPLPIERLFHSHSMDMSPAFVFFDLMARLLSPYQFNPLNYNPLRHVLEDSVDFDMLRERNVVKLFLCATNVRTGKIKIFDNSEISVAAVLASGCLPFLFQAVEIDGDSFWDGGYMGNPAIFPLIYGCRTADIVIVHVNPIMRDSVPRTAPDILNRINEVSFNSSLLREMRAIAFVSKLIDAGELRSKDLRRVLIHAIDAESVTKDLGVASKLNTDWEFLTHLHDLGRERTDLWLSQNFSRLGVDSTVDMRSKYL